MKKPHFYLNFKKKIAYIALIMFFSLNGLCYLVLFMLCVEPSYSMSFNTLPYLLTHTENKDYPNHYNPYSDSVLKINLGFLGDKDYEQRKNYLDNCFAYQCTSFGINFKINLPIDY
jgi:hypothetical protein